METLMWEARYALHRIRRGSPETPILAILAHDQLERIIETFVEIYKLPRSTVIIWIDRCLTEDELKKLLLENSNVYQEHLLEQDRRHRGKGRGISSHWYALQTHIRRLTTIGVIPAHSSNLHAEHSL